MWRSSPQITGTPRSSHAHEQWVCFVFGLYSQTSQHPIWNIIADNMAARSYHVVFSFLFECVARSFRRWIHFLQRFNTWTLARLLSVWFLFTARRARSRPVSKQLESDLRSRLRLFSFSFFRRPLSFTHMRILSASRGVLKYAMRTSEECNRNSNNQTRFARRGFWMWNWKTRVCNCGIVVVSQPQTHCPVRFAGVFNSQTKYIFFFAHCFCLRFFSWSRLP